MQQNRLIFSFGRRWGKSLAPNAKRLIKELLPTLQMHLPEDDKAQLDLRSHFPDKRVVRMEIGFGAGEHLAAQAKHNPDIAYIGCEPFMNGVAFLLKEIEGQALENIRIYTDDARLLCERLPDGCLERIDILFPDPWRKTRHHKRRLVSLDTLERLARLQPKGAELRLATDHVDYGEWMLEVLLQTPYYDWQVQSKADWHTPPADWAETRYQRKTSAQGRPPMFLLAKRV